MQTATSDRRERTKMLHLTSADPAKEKIETLVIPVCEDTEIHDHSTIVSIIKKAPKLKEFKGEKDDQVIFYNLPGTKVVRVILMGIGKRENVE